jgi:hypothetical protein
MVLRLDSGMINGVRMWPLKKPFRLYLILPVQRMPPLQLDHFEFFGGSNKWNVSFARAPHDWEIYDITSFFRVLYSTRVSRESEDKLLRVPFKRGLLKVKSFYCFLVCSEGCRFCFPYKAPMRVAFSAWLAILDKILTMNNRRKRHVIMVDRYCMCKMNEESVDNRFLHCDVAYAIWIAFFSCFGLSWVMLKYIIDQNACWCTTRSPRSAGV